MVRGCTQRASSISQTIRPGLPNADALPRRAQHNVIGHTLISDVTRQPLAPGLERNWPRGWGWVLGAWTRGSSLVVSLVLPEPIPSCLPTSAVGIPKTTQCRRAVGGGVGSRDGRPVIDNRAPANHWPGRQLPVAFVGKITPHRNQSSATSPKLAAFVGLSYGVGVPKALT